MLPKSVKDVPFYAINEVPVIRFAERILHNLSICSFVITVTDGLLTAQIHGLFGKPWFHVILHVQEPNLQVFHAASSKFLWYGEAVDSDHTIEASCWI